MSDMQVHMQPDLLRSGVEHWNSGRQHLPQRFHIGSDGDPRLRRLHIHDGLEAARSSVDVMHWIHRSRILQFRVNSYDLIQ